MHFYESLFLSFHMHQTQSIHTSSVREKADFTIQYLIQDSTYGLVLVAKTDKGICYLSFCNDEKKGLVQLESDFEGTTFIKSSEGQLFNPDFQDSPDLHLFGSQFQIEVWKKLMAVPNGDLWSYAKLAEDINKPKASRAVGTAVASNRIAIYIPCHRIVRSTGETGQYRWGAGLKKKIIEGEIG